MITVSSSITIPASVRAKEWCKENLELPNPDYEKKARMGLWLGKTPKYIRLYKINGNLIEIPYGLLRRCQEYAPNETIRGLFVPAKTIDYKGSDVPLYDYQERSVEAVLNSHFGILQSPAGSGKTQMGIAIIKRFRKRALWLTHTLDLLNQSKQRAEQYIDPSLIGTISEGKVNIGEGVTFATVQTMANLNLIEYRNEWDVIIVDECHRCAGTPTSVSQFYKVLNTLCARNKIGLSATVHRSDGLIKSTFALLGDIIYTVPVSAVGDKIVSVSVSPISTGVKASIECLNTDGSLNFIKLVSYLCENDERSQQIVDYIVINKDKSCLILSDRIEHLEKMMDLLPEDMRQNAVCINGKMVSKKAKAEREQNIELMRTGDKKYLFATYGLAKEGLDIPRLERLFLTTPHKDYAVITQCIGRIARKFEGKSEPICYDFVDDIKYLVSAYKKRCTIYRKNGCRFI